VSVLSSGHDVADARLHREVEALLRAGLHVEVLALGDPAFGPDGATVRTRPRGSMVSRARIAVSLPFRARGQVLVTLDPDLVPAGLVAAAMRRRRLVSDVHEDYVALLADRAWVPPAARPLLTRLAAACIALSGRARLTVVADEHLPPGAARCRRRLVVRNLPDPRMLPAAAGPRPAHEGRARRAVYIGDVRTSRGLRSMVEAVACAPGWELDVVGPVHAGDQEWLRERLGRSDLAGRVRLHGRQPPRAAWRTAEGADVGLLLLEDTPAFRDAVPTKLYEYLACGLAVLATPLPRVQAIVAESGAGVVVTDAAGAGAALRAWGADPTRLAALSTRALAWAADRASQASPYDVLAEEVAALAGRRPGPDRTGAVRYAPPG
jgi:glycosyltransferase involved in cell wall biosynthesis